jgi:Core-2/I-Branching enzyme
MEPANAAPGASIPFDKWRKSSQWSVLTRAHAAAVADDTAIDTIFRNVCYSRDWDAALERQYVCFSDEHYIPTLLALKGWDNQTDCLGYTVAVDWSQGGAHPKTYGAADITADTLASIRDSWGQCAAVAANAAAAALVVPPSSVTPAACATVAHAAGVTAANPMAAVWASRLTPRECSLFARKFPADTAAPLTAVLRDCRVNAIQPCVAPDLPRDGEDAAKEKGGGD